MLAQDASKDNNFESRMLTGLWLPTQRNVRAKIDANPLHP